MRGSGLEQGRVVGVTLPRQLGEWTEPSLARNHRTRAALRLERQIQIFQRLLGDGRQHLGAQTVVELPLLVNAAQDRRPPLLEFAQVGRTLLHVAQLHLIESARHFLAVARDERQGVALVEKRQRALDLRDGEGQFAGHEAHDVGRGKDELGSGHAAGRVEGRGPDRSQERCGRRGGRAYWASHRVRATP